MREEDVLGDKEVRRTLLSVIPSIVDKEYTEARVQSWLPHLADACLRALADLQRPYKIALSCHISQRSGAGLHVAAASHWCPTTDGVVTVQWQSDDASVVVTTILAAI
ncbi:hypothetical protein H632_c690p1 [Helicosporidium sp. ATCC 50920]|nr:hypothetical protein H632_c690p1 [Helicosporidium sp. ATCC 50920]|eukprot:KDD75426.1 hypothetical protein H632_c690p1 [Helicosporidium sp. ATCC 50920]